MTDESLANARPGDAASATPAGPVTLVLLDNDLFFVVKITDTLKHVGYHVRATRTLAEFERALGEEAPRLALVNTAARGMDALSAIRAARAVALPVVAFGSHVDLAAQEAARQAGATTVIPNARVASDQPAVVARTLRRDDERAERTERASDASQHGP